MKGSVFMEGRCRKGRELRFHEIEPRYRQAGKKRKRKFMLANLGHPVTTERSTAPNYANSIPKDYLSHLPAELRSHIYSYVVDFSGTIRVSANDFEPYRSLDRTSLALLGTCKVIREEVSELFYTQQTFVFISLPAIGRFRQNAGDFAKNVKKIAVTGHLMSQSIFVKQLELFFKQFPNHEYLTIGNGKDHIKTYQEEFSRIPFNFTRYDLRWHSITHDTTAKKILQASKTLAAGKVFYSPEHDEVRFEPSTSETVGRAVYLIVDKKLPENVVAECHVSEEVDKMKLYKVMEQDGMIITR